jgi:hypothetical protein
VCVLFRLDRFSIGDPFGELTCAEYVPEPIVLKLDDSPANELISEGFSFRFTGAGAIVEVWFCFHGR